VRFGWARRGSIAPKLAAAAQRRANSGEDEDDEGCWCGSQVRYDHRGGVAARWVPRGATSAIMLHSTITVALPAADAPAAVVGGLIMAGSKSVPAAGAQRVPPYLMSSRFLSHSILRLLVTITYF